MVVDSSFYMNLALREAWKYQGVTYPNPAVGCCVVGKHGEILAVNAHQRAGEPHAEVMALKDAYFKLTRDNEILKIEKSSDIHNFLLEHNNNIFEECSLFTTLEPCSHIGKTPSCANLIASLKIKQVYVGTLDFNEEAANGNSVLNSADVSVTSHILEEKCNDLLKPFELFNKERFVFFKWAQRLNATTDDGTISSAQSREYVHAMRDVCDLLVIGGNTVRIDRPTLDARLVNGKAPDVLIISHKKDFDRSIPLFNIQGRKVYIENNFSKIKNYKNIMIEGSAKMYELTRDIVDYYFCYIAPSFGGKSGFENVKDDFEILNIEKETQDIIMWMKRK